MTFDEHIYDSECSRKGCIMAGLEVTERTITCRVADVINSDLQCSQQINNMST